MPPSPYPGLRPFEKEEWPIYFGRETMIDGVIERLIENHLLVLHGDSGCGKSSLIRAGVLSRLEQESARGGITWRTATTLPRDNPLHNLAAALASLSPSQSEIQLRRMLNFGRSAATEVARLLRRDETDQVCILIDQFEELFAFARRHGREEAQLYAQFLVGVLEHQPPGLFVAVTMRSEYLGVCSQYNGLAEAVNRSQYLLPHMIHADLLRAIREPANLYNGEVSLDLATRLIADGGGGQDELPLIQHGLMRLHQLASERTAAGQPWRLDLTDYLQGPRLAGLLRDHADAVAGTLEHKIPRSATIIEQVFRALTDINTDGQAIRRPRTFGQLRKVTDTDTGELQQILHAFCEEGVSFLKPYGDADLGNHDLIDISHEALIRCWPRISDPKEGWLVEEFHDGLIWRSLLVQAQSFEADPHNLLSPTTTEERVLWLKQRNAAWSKRYGGGWERVQRLIEASEAAAIEIKRIEKERLLADQHAMNKSMELRATKALAKAEKAKRKRTLWGLITVGVLATITSVAGLIAWEQAQLAKEKAEAAEKARQMAESALQSLKEETARTAAAQVQAEKAQDWAAKTLAISYNDRTRSDNLSTAELLDRLKSTEAPYGVAIITQSIASLKQRLTQEQSTQMFQHLLGAVLATDDSGASRSLNQAILSISPQLDLDLSLNDALLEQLVDELRQDRTRYHTSGIATLMAMLSQGPLPANTADKAIQELITTLARLNDRDRLTALNRAIDDLSTHISTDQARADFQALRLAMAELRDETLAQLLSSSARSLSKHGKLPSPRVFTHIADASQRVPAKALTQGLADNRIYGDPVMVPGIELKSDYSSASALRCFREWECKTDAPALLKLINSKLDSPVVRLEDLSRRYAQSNIDPRHFELWFGPQEIRLKSQ